VDDHGTPRKHKNISVLFESFVKIDLRQLDAFKREIEQVQRRLDALEAK